MKNNCNLIVSFVKREIKRLVADGVIATAANFLFQLAQGYDPAKEDEVIILNCDISTFEKHQRLGILGFKMETEEKNRLAHRLLLISNSICKTQSQQNL